MKRWLALTSLTFLLAACTPPQPPGVLGERQLDLAQATTLEVSEPFAGTWRVSSVSPWLSVSSASGSGPVRFTVQADRNAATPVTADQATLSGQIKLSWNSEDGANSGSVTWTVSAQQYLLTGQVLEGASLSGADAAPPAAHPLSAQEVAPTRGVIVTYRSPAARDAALGLPGEGGAGGLSAQSVAALSARLDALGVPQAARAGLSERSVVLKVPVTGTLLAGLRADPAVLSATENVGLRELGGPSSQVATLPGSLGGQGTLAGQSNLTGQALAAPVTPSDQYAPLQWAYPLMGYGAVWRDMEGGGYTRPVTVAVIDSGVRFDHPDLEGQLWGPTEGALDVLTDTGNGDGDGADTDPTDPSVPGRTRQTHGTHVTGIIVARWGQNRVPCASCSPTGVVGAAYRAPVKVLPVRVLDSNGSTSVADVVNAVRYAAGLPVTLDGQTYTNPHPAQVINLSLGGPESSVSAEQAAPMCEAVAQAKSRGALVFAAAGNDGNSSRYYPAVCEGAVPVGSVSLSGASAPEHSAFSNAYAEVALVAPGGTSFRGTTTTFNGGFLNGQPAPDDIFSTGWDYAKNQPNFYFANGTSQATPQASALAALLLSKGVTTGPDDTLARMTATATDLGAPGRDPLFGSGVINAAAALGAPAVSDTLGLRLQDALGRPFQPALDPLGRFTAYLGDGDYQVTGGRDRDANGIYGEVHEPRATKAATLGPQAPRVDLGGLRPE